MEKEKIPLNDSSLTVTQEITPIEWMEKLRDPFHLPTHYEFSQAFPDEPTSNDRWFKFCLDTENTVYEFLNEEFITALTHYFEERITELCANTSSPVTILEIGAGNGRLSYFLSQRLKKTLGKKVRIVATDSGEYNIKPLFPVESIEAKEALEHYKPDIVIFSWMPAGKDFTADFRSTPSLKEYILIGEPDTGCCGDRWKTWGHKYPDEQTSNDTPPYEIDGFDKVKLRKISDLQICRTDTIGNYFHSNTVSFRRKK